MEKFTKKVALGKKNHKNTKKKFSNCLTKLREPLKGLDFHLLSWDARRGAPGRRETHDRRGAVCFCFLMGVSLCESRMTKMVAWETRGQGNLPYVLQGQH